MQKIKEVQEVNISISLLPPWWKTLSLFGEAIFENWSFNLLEDGTCIFSFCSHNPHMINSCVVPINEVENFLSGEYGKKGDEVITGAYLGSFWVIFDLDMYHWSIRDKRLAKFKKEVLKVIQDRKLPYQKCYELIKHTSKSFRISGICPRNCLTEDIHNIILICHKLQSKGFLSNHWAVLDESGKVLGEYEKVKDIPKGRPESRLVSIYQISKSLDQWPQNVEELFNGQLQDQLY